jgi:hypothetical protein
MKTQNQVFEPHPLICRSLKKLKDLRQVGKVILLKYCPIQRSDPQKTGCQVRIENGNPAICGHIFFVKLMHDCVAQDPSAIATRESAVTAAELRQTVLPQ